ncbi:MAG: hypothetical protein IKL68_02695 [Clostridia bacterium]|nr:hypothetical protein [Clostridia bacterium]
MKDLKITFVQDGKEQAREYDTLMDFMVHYEMSNDKKQITTAEEITAVFFEKAILTKKFNSIKELYEHCRAITF